MALKQRHLTKHDEYVLKLRDKIKHKYDFVSVNVKIPGKKEA